MYVRTSFHVCLKLYTARVNQCSSFPTPSLVPFLPPPPLASYSFSPSLPSWHTPFSLPLLCPTPSLPPSSLSPSLLPSIPLPPSTGGQCAENNLTLTPVGDGLMRVEICLNGRWGTVCGDESWDNNDAAVLCREFKLDNNGIWMGLYRILVCNLSKQTFTDCSYT